MISWVRKSHLLDLLDLIGLVPDGLVGREHLFEHRGASRICSAIATKSSKNRASRGISLNASPLRPEILADRPQTSPIRHLTFAWSLLEPVPPRN